MRKILLLIVVFALSVNCLMASDIKGRVVDMESNPLQNVSVYLKESPSVIVFTDIDGRFSISLPKGLECGLEDHVIFSRIGYELTELGVGEMKNYAEKDIVMFRSTYVFDDIVVSHKLSKKEQKKRKLSILEKFKKQALKDFKFKNRTFVAASDLEVIKEGKPMFYNKIIGEYKELIGEGKNNTDSILLSNTEMVQHMDKDMNDGLKQMSEKFVDDKTLSKKKRKKQLLDSTFYKVALSDSVLKTEMLVAHQEFWHLGRDINSSLSALDLNPKKWEIAESGDEMRLIYKNKKGFLGIVRYNSVVSFIVDPLDYSLKRVFEELSVELNIPFGYKLPPDALMLLNLINASDNAMSKYKLRHLNVDVVSNSNYKMLDKIKYFDEKRYDVKMSLTDTKKQNVKVDIKSLLKVLSVVSN